tara:strand:+ start:173 stop:985 length:813 start_codon:yes stop_codon:yes gene_type:complete
MEQVESLPFLNGSAFYFSSPSSEPNRKNQDSIGLFELTENSGVLVVADGIGGSRAGDQASKLIIETFKKELDNVEAKSLLLEGHSIVLKCNEAIRSLSCGAGSTISALFINNDQGLFIKAGDSLARQYSATGTLKVDLFNFSVGGMATSIGITENQMPPKLKKESNHLLNFLGSETPSMLIEGPFSINPKDCFFLCTDGINENINDISLEKIVIDLDPINKKNELIEKVRKTMNSDRGVHDDHSFIMLDLKISKESLTTEVAETSKKAEK